MLTVQSLSVFRGNVQAVRRVDLEVQIGEVVAILGANGAGKSSLMSAIAGLCPPSEGEIHWQGKRIDGFGAARIAQAGLALVPEGRQLLGSMTVRDNLVLGAYSQHLSSLWDLFGPIGRLMKTPEMANRLASVYELFPRLAERQTQLASSLSGGEQQMLAIGRALMSDPQVLLLDEPSIGLAPLLVREIMALLASLRERGMTILLVEQDAHAALRIADRGYLMESGRMVADGSSRNILQSAQLRRAYLGMA